MSEPGAAVVMVFAIYRMMLIAVVFSGIACTSDRVSVSDTNLKSGDGSNSDIGRPHASLLAAKEAKWKTQRIENYDFDLSASGYFRAFDPTVRISVRNSKSVSIKNTDGKVVRYLRIYEEFSTIDKLFEFLKSVNTRNPDRLFIAYDAEGGFPTYVDLDEKAGMSDDELTLKIANFAISYGE